MGWRLRENQIFMYRGNLDGVAQKKLPGGYVQLAAGATSLEAWVALLDSVFGDYDVERVRRQVVDSGRWDGELLTLVGCAGRPVALSLAWSEPELWPHSGQVFWVAVDEEHRGKGLGRYALTEALVHLTRVGYSDAVLYTEDFRLTAVRLYLQMGFVPMITGTTEDELARWEKVAEQIAEPGLTALVRQDYALIARAC